MEDNSTNSSNVPAASPPQSGAVPEPFGLMVFRVTLFSIVITMSLVGNFMVCFTVYRNKRMRNFSHCLITNLAIVDICMIFFSPLYVHYFIVETWTFGEFMCRISTPSLVLCVMVATNTLTAVALERFRAVNFPFKPKPSPYQTKMAIALIWLIAFLCTLPSYGLQSLVSAEAFGIMGSDVVWCVEQWPGTPEEKEMYRRIYGLFMFTLNYGLPVVIIVSSYIIIGFKLKANAKALKEARTDPAGKKGRLHKTERRFVHMLVAVVATFILCYLPYQFIFILLQFDKSFESWPYYSIANHFITLLTFLPSALNPIFYGSLDAQYARGFKKIARCSFGKESWSQKWSDKIHDLMSRSIKEDSS